MIIQNPIIPGFHPDPSICKVENDYYLVTSSFEYFPGIPVFHSKDLIHWEQINHCINRPNQLTLRKGFPNRTGIYAATIRYHKDTFYVITTNIAYGGEDEGSFIITTNDPAAEWSDPIFLDLPGIDPSLFFEDEHAYCTGCFDNHIYLCEIDLETGKRIGEMKNIWAGTGGNDPEGPHLYKKDGWYYLMISEGGTEYGHMVTMARSKDIAGPYISCPHNPVLSNRSHSTNIKGTGHADLIEDQNGNWWAVCLGFRCITYPFKYNLGRETMLLPVEWSENEWPVFGNNGILEDNINTYLLPLTDNAETTLSNVNIAGNTNFYDNFSSDSLNLCWNFIYNKEENLFSLDQNSTGITLYGNATSLNEPDSIAWIGHRQEHHKCLVQTKLSFVRENDLEEAGLTIYMNNCHHYEVALTRIDQKNCLIFRRQIGSLYRIENKITIPDNEIILQLEADEQTYSFSYSTDQKTYTEIGSGECGYLTTEVGGQFTGNYIGLYASGNGKKCSHGAHFHWFSYKA